MVQDGGGVWVLAGGRHDGENGADWKYVPWREWTKPESVPNVGEKGMEESGMRSGFWFEHVDDAVYNNGGG